MPMNHVGWLKAGDPDLSDPSQLVVQLVAHQAFLGTDMCKDAVASPLAHIERLAIPRIDQTVDIGLKLSRDLRGKGFAARESASAAAHAGSGSPLFPSAVPLAAAPHS